MITVDAYVNERECEFKGEKYIVRDNGAVMRLSKKNYRKRKLDNKWTFGVGDKTTGYLKFSSIPIHRIIATAFLGSPKDSNHVVDHINTNRQDNTPGNLRWVTRFENVFLNPITCRNLEMLTGLTIDEIIQNPKILENYKVSKNIAWMRKVSSEESRNCYQNLMNWALNSRIEPSKKRGTIGEWVYQTRYLPPKEDTLEHGKVDKVYPCCPSDNEERSLENYQRKLQPGTVFLETEITKYVAVESTIFNGKLIVRTRDVNEQALKPWFVSRVTLENGRFQHELVKSCFVEEGSKEFFDIMQDKPWESNHSFDYMC